jgi:multidrug efflux pump subunit AcrA (membrane-fusion protein)
MIMKPLLSIYRSRAVTAALIGGLGMVLSTGWVLGADDVANNAASPITATAITRPSKERQLKFAAPGVVSEVSIKEGDTITVHQILAKQDSRQDEWQLKYDQREAKDRVVQGECRQQYRSRTS